jgi:conjugative relaxase-like TrwC/TraI family protein
MLHIIQQKSARSAKRCYLSDGYYSEGRGIVGSWGGKGASRLGLNGTVDRFSFRQLCDNLRPRSGTPVTMKMRSKRTVGYHSIFSVSKSVSLLHAMYGDHTIVDAFRAAVDETMREMEGVRAHFQNAVKQLGRKVLILLLLVVWGARWSYASSAGLACRENGRSSPGGGRWPGWH